MKEELAKCKKLRQDLEKARLLLEQVRKRERIKRDMVRLERLITLYEVNPFNGVFLQHILNQLFDLDRNQIFWYPVEPQQAPSYYTVIKEPMDLERMQAKVDAGEYANFALFEADFHLIITNCCKFNPKSSVFYKAAIKLKEQVRMILQTHLILI